ncbi:unnamed protein product [Effrenium voratum]|nr:unnamed protein product [Effrenium voratum]
MVGSLGLFRDSFRLLWMGQELTMDLLPSERPQVVRVAAERGGLSVAAVQSLLTLVKATLAQKSHLSFSAGVLCEHCHAQGRSQAERHHVLDVSELLAAKDGLLPCRASARAVQVPGSSWAAQWCEAARGLPRGPFGEARRMGDGVLRGCPLHMGIPKRPGGPQILEVWSEQLRDFWQEGRFCDIALRHGARAAALSATSKFFKTLLSGAFRKVTRCNKDRQSKLQRPMQRCLPSLIVSMVVSLRCRSKTPLSSCDWQMLMD